MRLNKFLELRVGMVISLHANSDCENFTGKNNTMITIKQYQQFLNESLGLRIRTSTTTMLDESLGLRTRTYNIKQSIITQNYQDVDHDDDDDENGRLSELFTHTGDNNINDNTNL